MEFPLVGLTETNGSNATIGKHLSLYGRQPVVAGLYVGVLGVAAVVGTLGNVAVITTLTVRHIRSRRTSGNDVGRAFIVNLALSDLIVTSVINPLAIAGENSTNDRYTRGTERVQALADISRSALCCHSNETRAPIATSPNSAQLGFTPYRSPKLDPGLCSRGGVMRGTDRHIHRRP